MKAPTEKSNDTIQILVTRGCDLFHCSNCTQLLPYRTDSRNMSPDVFRSALRSIHDWPGIRGIFGGNPCVHPQFEQLMEILVEEVPDQRKRGIWTNNLMGHGPLVREVFYPSGRFNLNAHAVEGAAVEFDRYLPGRIIPSSRSRLSWHSPILMAWQDLGISEADWVELRETCDINQNWSAAIMERDGAAYAYFCEVAGALDGVRGENNGIKVFPGWWRLPSAAFDAQVRACCDRGCGIPLRALGHLENDWTYDVTEAFRPAIERRASSKPVAVFHERLPESTEAPTDYQALRTHKPATAEMRGSKK